MDDLNFKIVDILKNKGLTLAIAESLTGGLVCSCICEVSGASAVLLEGIVSYTDESKVTRLGVDIRTIETHTSVSPETAKEMAQGVRKNLSADIGISTTGVAGPDETDGNGNPRGLVYIGISTDQETIVSKHIFEGTRNVIREKAKNTCIEILYKALY